MVIVRVSRLTLKHETEVLEVAVPLPDLIKVRSLWRLGDRVAGPDSEKMPAAHPYKRGANDGNIEPKPSSK